MKTENTEANNDAAFRDEGFEDRCFIWKIRVGITLNTSNVVDEG